MPRSSWNQSSMADAPDRLLQPGRPRRLGRLAIGVLGEQVVSGEHRHAHAAAAVEPVERIVAAEADEDVLQVVDLGVHPPGTRHVDRHAVADAGVGPQPERGSDGRQGARLDRVLRAAGADIGDRPASEVAEVLAQRVQIEVGVAAGAVILGVPVAGEDAAVHVAKHRTARRRLDLVLERVREVIALRAHGQVARRVEHGHGVAGPYLADVAVRALTGWEHPAGGAVAGRDRVPYLLGGPGHLDLTPYLELAAHGASFRLVCIRLGCSATTSRWRRPPRAPSV